MLHVADLQYRYAGAPDFIAVPEFTLSAGQHAILLGPSGCGKSTLLHLFAAILAPQQGELQVAGTDLARISARDRDRWRGRQVGFLPQRLALVASLTVLENLLLACYANGTPPDKQRAASLLQALGLEHKHGARPAQLSQGQQQRVAIARALFNRPRLLLADEPTANLDDDACRAALELLTSQTRAIGASLVIATHDARVLNALPEAKVLRLPALGAGRVQP